MVTIILAGAAMVISLKLLAKHLTGQSGSKWFEAGCPVNAEPGGANCTVVLQSPYSYWPPKKTAEGTQQQPKFTRPVAYWGLVYFSMVAAWMIGVGRPSRDRRWWHLVPLILVGLGLIGSARFTYLMYAEIKMWCPWCLATHLINLLIAVCLVWLWPRASARGLGDERLVTGLPPGAPIRGRQSEPRAPARGLEARATGLAARSHPTWRLAMTTGLGAAVLWGAEEQLYLRVATLIEGSSTRAGYTQCMDYLNRLKADPNRLLKMWDVSDEVEVPVRPDDPIRTQAKPDGTPFLEVIVFSDFECPSCKLFADSFERQIQPLFGGRLKLVFKHYPLNSECNGKVATRFHPNACTAVKIVEAARLQGGNEAFWRAHDLLFSMQQLPPVGLKGLDPRAVAEKLGLDAERLSADMSSEAAARRVWEDVNEGAKLNIISTPWIIAHRKPVDSLAFKEIGFWDALAESYWHSIETPRPESTRPKAASAGTTPGTPVPTGGP
jgi:protein-disulfide isomerase/uncharacterized membrane protein